MIDEKFDELARMLATFGSPNSLAALELIQRNERASFDEILDECKLGIPSTTTLKAYLNMLVDRNVIRFEDETRSYVFNPAMPLYALRVIDALFPVADADAEEETRSALIKLIQDELTDIAEHTIEYNQIDRPRRSAQLADKIIAMLLGTEE